MLCGWNRGRRLSVMSDHQCRISHWRHGAHSPRCFARTALRHRVCVSPGMWMCGAGLHWRRYAWPRAFSLVCGSARPTVSPGGRMGRGERREHTLAAGHFASQLKWDRLNDRADASARGAMAKAHEGGALTFSVLAVYFGCCLVAADASLCIHLSSVSVWQLFSGLST